MAEQYLHDLYYNPESPASFGGGDAVYRKVKNDGGNLKYRETKLKIG